MSENTKLVPQWHINTAYLFDGAWHPWVELQDTYEEALAVAEILREAGAAKCVEVTGPHYYKVPA